MVKLIFLKINLTKFECAKFDPGNWILVEMWSSKKLRLIEAMMNRQKIIDESYFW